MPRDRFVVAGDAWVRCRAGESDPGLYGLSLFNEAGLWRIAADLLRDVASLRSMEMLPWDVWGAMPAPEDTIGEDRLALVRPAGRARPAPGRGGRGRRRRLRGRPGPGAGRGPQRRARPRRPGLSRRALASGGDPGEQMSRGRRPAG